MGIHGQRSFGWVVALPLDQAQLCRIPRPLIEMLDKAQILRYNFTK
jgi:hypothetical protein